MKKIPHYITPSKKKTMPTRVVFFDVESRVPEEDKDKIFQTVLAGESITLEHEPYLICATFCDYEKNTEKSEVYTGELFAQRFWARVTRFAKTRGTTYIFAHNAKYDVLASGCLKHLIDYGYTVNGFSSDNPFILNLSMKNNKQKNCKSLLILSTTNYFKDSLKKLGDMVGLPKLDSAYNDSLQKAITYCKRDVEILKRVTEQYMEFIKTEKLGAFGVTVAAQAFQAYRARFINEHIRVHNFTESTILERAAYSGGRTEAFFIGRVPCEVFYLDVNSMYPYVMKNQTYPVELAHHSNKLKNNEAIKLIKQGYKLIARCSMKTNEAAYAVKRERLIFPVGEFEAVLCTPEIIYALSKNHIVNIIEALIYIPGDLFSGYVDYFYSRRLEAKKEGNEIYTYLYKLFLNSLYGKFGQTAQEYIRIGDCPRDSIGSGHYLDSSGQKLNYYKWFGGSIFMKEDKKIGENESYHSFPAVAAHVTAEARMLLYRGMRAAGNIYYCDTDSICTDEQGYSNLLKAGLIDPSLLGAFKLEQQGSMTIYGLKDYVFNGKAKIKGLSSRSEHIADNNFVQTNWIGLDRAIHDGNLNGYKNILNKKTIRQTEYQKGRVMPGGDVLPIDIIKNDNIMVV